jgi:hypothetical protein
MATEQTNKRARLNSGHRTAELRAPWGRPLAVTAGVVFFISLAFPVVAGLSENTESFPKWWGPLDVGLAFVLAILALVIVGLTQGNVDKQAEDASYRAYRILNHGILVMSAVFMLCGDRIIWINCVTGFAWRTWLLVYCLPAWLTLLQGGLSSDESTVPNVVNSPR